jgi:hypothetical protein
LVQDYQTLDDGPSEVGDGYDGTLPSHCREPTWDTLLAK